MEKLYNFKVINRYFKSGLGIYDRLKARLYLIKLLSEVAWKVNCIFVEFLSDHAYYLTRFQYFKKPVIVRCHRTELYEGWLTRRDRIEYAAKNCNLIICVSNFIRNRLIRLIPEVKSKSVVIYNSVDAKKIKPIKYYRARKTFVVGSLGRLIPIKGFEELILSVGELIAEGYNIVLKIGGDGPLMNKLKLLVKSMNLKKRNF